MWRHISKEEGIRRKRERGGKSAVKEASSSSSCSSRRRREKKEEEEEEEPPLPLVVPLGYFLLSCLCHKSHTIHTGLQGSTNYSPPPPYPYITFT